MAQRVTFESNWAPKGDQLERVRKSILDVHDNEETVYTSCSANGCFDLCVLKVHKKNNKITAIETDDTCNLTSGREDAYIPEETLKRGIIQHRACPRGRAWKEGLYSKTRLLYPMMQTGERGDRNGFKRISWNEALDRVAEGYMKTREKYGPYSVWMDSILGNGYDPFAQFLPGGGCAGSGMDSYFNNFFADDMVYGFKMDMKAWQDGTGWSGTEGPAILEADLIILWGFDTVLNYPEYQYWYQLAKDKGIPIIYIDPRMTNTAQAIATQYIAIRPGTDSAAMCAMAYVMFKEGLYDKAFVEKYVEPTGFEKWRQYIMGEEPGEIPKSPRWAEKICGIPAQTIEELTRLYASKNAVHFRQVWGASRIVNGFDTARIYNYINIMGGNVGKPGTVIGTSFDMTHLPTLKQRIFPYLGTPPAEYQSPITCETEQWARAVLLREKYDKGEISAAEYRAKVGCPANNPLPNIHSLIYLNESPRQFIGNYQDTNERIAATKKLDFVAAAHWELAASSCWYADILLPQRNQFFEGGSSAGYWQTGPFAYGLAPAVGNYMTYYSKVVDAPGECMHPWWIEKEIAKRMGLGDKVMPFLKDVEPEDMDEAVDKIMGGLYENWASSMTEYDDETVPKDWASFKKKPVIVIPFDKPMTKYEQEMKDGAPFRTPSGKLEFYSEHLAHADPKVKYDLRGAATGNGASPMARWNPSPESLFSAKVNEYPLYLVTPHSFFRQNLNQDANMMSRDEYRNSVWISVPDAKARGIRDGDLVLAYNDAGEVMVPAYVTSRMTPGCACLIFGRYYSPSAIKTEKMPDGIDRWGNCNFLIPNNQHDDIIGPILCAALIDVKRVDENLDDLVALSEKGEM